MRTLSRIALLCLAGALLIAGCGGGGNGDSVATVTAPTGTGASGPAKPAGPSDAKQIEKVIDDVLAGGKPSVSCTTAVTAGYVKRTYDDVKTCEQSQGPGSAAKSVKVSAIKVSGDTATAVAVPKGGPSDGEKITVKLLRQGGAWKLDDQHSNAPVGP